MKKFLFLIIVFIAFVAESRISVFGVSPDLTAAIAYYVGLRHGETKGMLFGSFIGFIADGLSGGIIGPNMLGKGLVGFFASFMSGNFFRWTPLLGMIGIAALTVLDVVTAFVSRSIFGFLPTSAPHAVYIIIISAIMNSVLGALFRPKNDQ